VSTNQVISAGRRRRRSHSELFKAEAIGACQQEGVSIAAVALARGINANMLRCWVRKAERSNAPIAIRRSAPLEVAQQTESFVPVSLPASAAGAAIRVEVRSKGRIISIEWPASAARECAVWLRELTK
jgi:transposase-like protein